MKKTLPFLLMIVEIVGVFLLPEKSLADQYSPEKIFYLAPYNAVKGVADVQKNWQKIDILAPQYFTVNNNFSVSGSFGPKLKRVIATHRIKVMPLISNAHFSQAIIHNLLLSPAGQDSVINFMVNKAKSQNYIGWQFDFENISYLDKDLFTAFVQKTYAVFQKNNLIFSVAVVPRVTDYEDTDAYKNWGGVYDYQKIAQSSDFVSLMTYDDSNSVGPSSSIAYLNQALAYVKDKIPANKLSLGVPFYSWKWSVAQNKKIGEVFYNTVLNIMDNFRYLLEANVSLGVSSITYVSKNQAYKIWVENKQSFQAKLDVIKANNLRGFSAWLLGSEDPSVWSVLTKTNSH